MGDKPRKFFDQMSEYAVNELDAKGLAWVKIDENKDLTGGISKFINNEQKESEETDCVYPYMDRLRDMLDSD